MPSLGSTNQVTLITAFSTPTTILAAPTTVGAATTAYNTTGNFNVANYGAAPATCVVECVTTDQYGNLTTTGVFVKTLAAAVGGVPSDTNGMITLATNQNQLPSQVFTLTVTGSGACDVRVKVDYTPYGG